MTNKHNELIGYLVYNAQRSMHHSLEVTLKPFSITPGQWNLLNQLDRSGELSQTALAKLLQKEQATITRYLDTLERKEMVQRKRDVNDRRAHVVFLTDKARKLLKEIEPFANVTAGRLVEDIEQKDLDTFVEVLAKLKANAEETTKQNGS